MLNQQLLDQYKVEIANEMGITLGANTTARDNGRVGAEMTKRLVEMGKRQLEGSQQVNPYMMNNVQPEQNRVH